jgi:DNA polymerase-3 subunit epsilon
MIPESFVAIDFEAADTHPDSACAVGVVRVENAQITDRYKTLIRPPRISEAFTRIHGITTDMQRSAPPFSAIWPTLKRKLEAPVFVAHNASFDRVMLEACCRSIRARPPVARYLCSLELSGQRWGLLGLADVCAHLGITLNHHDPLSDAEASAMIVLAALRAKEL